MRHQHWIVFAAVAGLVAVACGEGGSGDPFGTGGSSGASGSGGIVLTCDSLLDPPADCGKSCASNSECTGSYCEDGECIANCTDNEGCGTNEYCDSRGRCRRNPTTGGTGGVGGGGGECQFVTITPTRSIPNVMFLVDQSGSMDRNDFGPRNLKRWTAAHTAITQIIAQTESIVRFGLTTY